MTVTAEDGTVTATSTDGMASAMLVPPPVHAVGLPAMHDLSGWLTANPAGTVTVPAGEHRDVGGVRFSCPAGGADCAVTVTLEDGTVASTSTDGMASAMLVPPHDRWERIYEIADTLLQSSDHLRYTFNWTGRGQSTSDHVVTSYSCTGSRCVGGGRVITVEDFRNPDHQRQVTVPAEAWDHKAGLTPSRPRSMWTSQPKTRSWFQGRPQKSLVGWGHERIETGPCGSPCG